MLMLLAAHGLAVVVVMLLARHDVLLVGEAGQPLPDGAWVSRRILASLEDRLSV